MYNVGMVDQTVIKMQTSNSAEKLVDNNHRMVNVLLYYHQAKTFH